MTTNAVVLKRQKLQDNDVLVTLLTDKGGKLKAIAKGAKSGRSGLAAATQPFVFGEFVLSLEKDWNKIRSVDVSDPYAKLHDELVAMTYGTYVLELTHFLLEEGVVHHKAFVNLVDTLDLLCEDGAQLELIKTIYEIKMMVFSGYQMTVDRCQHCGIQNNEFLWFSVENGGIICDKCKDSYSELWLLGKTLPKIIDYMQKKNIRTVAKTQINSVYLEKLSQLMKRYMRVHTGFTGSKSLELLESIRLL
jgi:DNA repair protein RecO (recombination protein O)